MVYEDLDLIMGWYGWVELIVWVGNILKIFGYNLMIVSCRIKKLVICCEFKIDVDVSCILLWRMIVIFVWKEICLVI